MSVSAMVRASIQELYASVPADSLQKWRGESEAIDAQMIEIDIIMGQLTALETAGDAEGMVAILVSLKRPVVRAEREIARLIKETINEIGR